MQTGAFRAKLRAAGYGSADSALPIVPQSNFEDTEYYGPVTV